MAYSFTRGLHDLGNGAFAWLQPDGGWGWSNAGLIADGDQSLLVDTLFDEKLTAEMLSAMEDATRLKPGDIDTLVNTHANGDHCHGNGLVPNAEIIASSASAAEMTEIDPAYLAQIMRSAPNLGDVGQYLIDIFGQFDFDSISMRSPTRTFDKEERLKVGDKQVVLTNVGPAHTRGDVLVHVPQDKTIFTGDILFIDGTPIMWEGPVKNWLNACDQILSLDVETIVPGHGPITDKQGVKKVKDYLSYVDSEARKCFDAGLSADEAVAEIQLGTFSHWTDFERIAVNVHILYKEYANDDSPPDILALFAAMANTRATRKDPAF